jgi:hypothetical protein
LHFKAIVAIGLAEEGGLAGVEGGFLVAFDLLVSFECVVTVGFTKKSGTGGI